MICKQCGKENNDFEGNMARFCANCGAPLFPGTQAEQMEETTAPGAADDATVTLAANAADPWTQATETNGPGRTAPPIDRTLPVQNPAPPAPPVQEENESEKKRNRTLLILAVLLILLLLCVCIVLVIRLRRGKTEDAGGSPAVLTVSVEAKEEAFRNAIHVVDASAFPNNRESGYFETWVGDLTGDGEEEYVAFYGDFANEDQPTVDVHLYDFDYETGEASKKDELDNAFSIKPYHNGSIFLCVFLQDGDLCLCHAGIGSGGSMWYRRDLRFTVEDGRLKLLYHFYEYENNGANDIHTFEERVSGETYADPAAIQTARLARGVNVHRHGVNDRNVFPEDHILVLYWNNNFDETGETGYLLLRFFTPHTGTAMPEETERETVVSTTAPTTTEPTTTEPTTEPTTEAASSTVDVAALWQQLQGYWILESGSYTRYGGNYFNFDSNNGTYNMGNGAFQLEGDFYGSVFGDVTRNDDGTLSITFFMPGDGQLFQDQYDDYLLDVSDISNGHIRIKEKNEWQDGYLYGRTYEEAVSYQASLGE